MDKGLGYPTLLDGLKPAGPKSNVELRASAAGGFGPRDPKGVARTPPPAPPKSAKFGLSPPRAASPLGDRAGSSKNRKSTPH